MNPEKFSSLNRKTYEGLRTMERRAKYPQVKEGEILTSLNNKRGVEVLTVDRNLPEVDERKGVARATTHIEVAIAGNLRRIAPALLPDVSHVNHVSTEGDQPVRLSSFEKTGPRSFNVYDITLVRPGKNGAK